MLLTVEKCRVVIEAAADGNKDGSAESKRSTETSVHLWCSKMPTAKRVVLVVETWMATFAVLCDNRVVRLT